MANLTKEQLLEKNEAELVAIAEQLGKHVSKESPKESIIYTILDAQAEAQSAELGTPKKRTRIVKKDADHVFTSALRTAEAALASINSNTTTSTSKEDLEDDDEGV